MNKVSRSKNKHWMENYLGGYWKYAWTCLTCGRAWISREVAQNCRHTDEVQNGHNSFLHPIKLDEETKPTKTVHCQKCKKDIPYTTKTTVAVNKAWEEVYYLRYWDAEKRQSRMKKVASGSGSRWATCEVCNEAN